MKVVFEPLHDLFVLPKKGTPDAAGWDMVACIDAPIELSVGQRVAIPLGCRAHIPKGYSVEVLPRSGLALKDGVTLLNTPGLVDCDYVGQWHAILVYVSDTLLAKDSTGSWKQTAKDTPFIINPGMRICQVVLRKVEPMEVELGTVDLNTQRGEGGFGSTGT